MSKRAKFILVAAGICLLVTLVFLWRWTRPAPLEFDRVAWHAASDFEKQRMAVWLELHPGEFLGLRRPQVIEQLGEPMNPGLESEIWFDLGTMLGDYCILIFLLDSDGAVEVVRFAVID